MFRYLPSSTQFVFILYNFIISSLIYILVFITLHSAKIWAFSTSYLVLQNTSNPCHFWAQTLCCGILVSTFSAAVILKVFQFFSQPQPLAVFENIQKGSKPWCFYQKRGAFWPHDGDTLCTCTHFQIHCTLLKVSPSEHFLQMAQFCQGALPSSAPWDDAQVIPLLYCEKVVNVTNYDCIERFWLLKKFLILLLVSTKFFCQTNLELKNNSCKLQIFKYTELRLRVKYFITRSEGYSLHGYRYFALVLIAILLA